MTNASLMPAKAAHVAIKRCKGRFYIGQEHAEEATDLVHGGDADALSRGSDLLTTHQVLERVQVHPQDLGRRPAQGRQHRQRV